MARPKASLKEVMGSAAKGVSLSNLNDVLGEKMPRLPKNKVGKLRLIQALKNRFGTGFRNLPGVQDVLKDFDSEISTQSKINKMRSLKVE